MRVSATTALTVAGTIAIGAILLWLALQPSSSNDEDELSSGSLPGVEDAGPDTSPSTSVMAAPSEDAPALAPSTSPSSTLPPGPPQLYVSPTGVDRADRGLSIDEPLATPNFAVSIAESGDTINLLPGTYEPVVISGKQGLIVRAPQGGVVLTANTYENMAGVLIEESSDIVIEGLAVTKSLWGIRVFDSSGIDVLSNQVYDIGQEAIHVLNLSSDVTIEGNRIDVTGQRPGGNGEFAYADLGEGIYLGTGGTLANGQVDAVSNVRVVSNEVSNTSAEAIEIKASVFDVVVRDNLVYDIDVHSGAAISIGRGVRTYDANVVVENNAIWNITTRNPWNDGIGIRVSSPAVVSANVIWNVEHFGIKIDDELRNVEGSVDIRNNLVFDAGIDELVNDASAGQVPIAIEGTIAGDEARSAFERLGGVADGTLSTELFDYLNGL